VQDERTLLLPDRRGNHRLDSLRNILTDPRVALLCLIPGRNETLRINGRARISADPALRASLAVDGKLPACVVVISIEVVYFQCARALLRSRLWQVGSWQAAGQPAQRRTDAQRRHRRQLRRRGYDRALPLRQRDSLY